MYHQARNFTRALKEFRLAEDAGIRTANVMNFIGMCEGQRGDLAASIAAHRQAMQLDVGFREAILNCAQMHKELGQDAEAAAYFQRVIDIDAEGGPSRGRKPMVSCLSPMSSPHVYQNNNLPSPSSPPSTRHTHATTNASVNKVHAYTYRSQMHYGLGDPQACLVDCKAALALQGQDKEPAILVLAALSCVSLGTYRQAVVYFDLALGTSERAAAAWCLDSGCSLSGGVPTS